MRNSCRAIPGRVCVYTSCECPNAFIVQSSELFVDTQGNSGDLVKRRIISYAFYHVVFLAPWIFMLHGIIPFSSHTKKNDRLNLPIGKVLTTIKSVES